MVAEHSYWYNYLIRPFIFILFLLSKFADISQDSARPPNRRGARTAFDWGAGELGVIFRLGGPIWNGSAPRGDVYGARGLARFGFIRAGAAEFQDTQNGHG